MNEAGQTTVHICVHILLLIAICPSQCVPRIFSYVSWTPEILFSLYFVFWIFVLDIFKLTSVTLRFSNLLEISKASWSWGSEGAKMCLVQSEGKAGGLWVGESTAADMISYCWWHLHLYMETSVGSLPTKTACEIESREEKDQRHRKVQDNHGKSLRKVISASPSNHYGLYLLAEATNAQEKWKQRRHGDKLALL